MPAYYAMDELTGANSIYRIIQIINIAIELSTYLKTASVNGFSIYFRFYLGNTDLDSNKTLEKMARYCMGIRGVGKCPNSLVPHDPMIYT